MTLRIGFCDAYYKETPMLMCINRYRMLSQKSIIIAMGEIIGFRFYSLKTVCGRSLVTLHKEKRTHFSFLNISTFESCKNDSKIIKHENVNDI